MKYNSRIKSLFLALGAIASTTFIAVPQAQAISFQEQPVNPDQFAVVAVPFGYKEHRLEIIEQIPGGKKCWNEAGVAPTQVDLLLLDYDYTGSCRRITDTNGYTLRLNGQDETVAHVLKIVENNGELQLVAFHKDASQPNIVIGRTNGLSGSAMKLTLNPGWQITKRIHQGQVINHLYLSGDNSINQNTYSAISNTSTSINGSKTSTSTATTNTTVNTPNPPLSNVDTEALVQGVNQIYNNVVNPFLENLAQENSRK
jgi:hypothetical protein